MLSKLGTELSEAVVSGNIWPEVGFPMSWCICFLSLLFPCVWPHQQEDTQPICSEGAPHCPNLFILGVNLKTGIRVPPSKTEELKAMLVTVSVTDIHWCVLLPANLKAAPTNASKPGLPFYCFLSQHPIACQERDTTQNGQVLQSLEHVELSPVDIHKSQHCCEKRESRVETVLQRKTISYSQNDSCTATPKHLVSNLSLKLQRDRFKDYVCITARRRRHLGFHILEKCDTDSLHQILRWHNYGHITDFGGY